MVKVKIIMHKINFIALVFPLIFKIKNKKSEVSLFTKTNSFEFFQCFK